MTAAVVLDLRCGEDAALPRTHLTRVSIRKESDGSYLGTAVCEVCGALSSELYMDTHEAVLREIAGSHREEFA